VTLTDPRERRGLLPGGRSRAAVSRYSGCAISARERGAAPAAPNALRLKVLRSENIESTCEADHTGGEVTESIIGHRSLDTGRRPQRADRVKMETSMSLWTSKIALAVVLSATFTCSAVAQLSSSNHDIPSGNVGPSDRSEPESLAVLKKLMEVETVGDLKAALSLFAGDAIIINIVGGRFVGHSLKYFIAADISAHDQFLMESPQVKGDKVEWTRSVTAGFYATLGVAPVQFAFEAIVQRGKVKSIVAHLPTAEIARIEAACRARPKEPLIYGQPCGEFVQYLKEHTQSVLRDARAQAQPGGLQVAASK